MPNLINVKCQRYGILLISYMSCRNKYVKIKEAPIAQSNENKINLCNNTERHYREIMQKFLSILTHRKERLACRVLASLSSIPFIAFPGHIMSRVLAHDVNKYSISWGVIRHFGQSSCVWDTADTSYLRVSAEIEPRNVRLQFLC